MPERHRPELSESVSGEPLVTYRRSPRTFHPGRTCAMPGCPTVLSIYNGGQRCAAHSVNSRTTTIGTVAASPPPEAAVSPPAVTGESSRQAEQAPGSALREPVVVASRLAS